MFLCNHNSCRSQMADGWLRHLRGGASVGVASAGIVGGTAVKPGAIAVMREAGVDISPASAVRPARGPGRGKRGAPKPSRRGFGGGGSAI